MTQRALTWQDASEIRAKYATGRYTLAVIGQHYGVDHTTVCRIVKGEFYRTETDTRVAETRPERAVPPIPSTMSGEMPPQLPGEDVHAYALRHNEFFHAHNARVDARSEALLPGWRAEYAAAVESVRAWWRERGLDGDAETAVAA